jgi:hypothetical protein
MINTFRPSSENDDSTPINSEIHLDDMLSPFQLIETAITMAIEMYGLIWELY